MAYARSLRHRCDHVFCVTVYFCIGVSESSIVLSPTTTSLVSMRVQTKQINLFGFLEFRSIHGVFKKHFLSTFRNALDHSLEFDWIGLNMILLRRCLRHVSQTWNLVTRTKADLQSARTAAIAWQSRRLHQQNKTLVAREMLLHVEHVLINLCSISHTMSAHTWSWSRKMTF